MVILYFSQLVLSLILKIEDRQRFGSKKEQVHFVLLSTCTIFAPLWHLNNSSN